MVLWSAQPVLRNIVRNPSQYSTERATHPCLLRYHPQSQAVESAMVRGVDKEHALHIIYRVM